MDIHAFIVLLTVANLIVKYKALASFYTVNTMCEDLTIILIQKSVVAPSFLLMCLKVCVQI